MRRGFRPPPTAAPATGASGLKSSVAAKKAATAEPAKASAPAEVDQETGEVLGSTAAITHAPSERAEFDEAGADKDFIAGMDGRPEPEAATAPQRARRERTAATME